MGLSAFAIFFLCRLGFVSGEDSFVDPLYVLSLWATEKFDTMGGYLRTFYDHTFPVPFFHLFCLKSR